MRGQNRLLKEGSISRLPLLIGIGIAAAALITIFYAGHAASSKPDNSSGPVQMSKAGGELKAMLERGDEVIKKDEEARLKREKLQAGPQNEDLTPQELRQKALALEEEARQASEYADSLEGIKRDESASADFEKDYRAYIEDTDTDNAKKSKLTVRSGESTERRGIDDDRERTYRQNHSQRVREFEQALRSPSRIEIKKISSEDNHSWMSKGDGKDEGNATRYRTLSDYSGFSQSDGDFVLDARVTPMKTPWCLRQGSVIPAILVSAVNSDLPGLVTAQVPSDVLDSVYGKDVLIPSGTMITGQYGASPGYGQERLFIAFSRLLFPDGTSLAIGAMPGQGKDGAGFEADVDNHFLRLFTGSFLISAISASVSASERNNDDDYSYGSALGGEAAESLGATLSKILDRNLNLSPTLNVKPGYSFSVAVTKDIYFNGPYGTGDFSK